MNTKIKKMKIYRLSITRFPGITLKQANHEIDVIVKAKTKKRCVEIFNKFVFLGKTNYFFDNFALNCSDREEALNLTKGYKECVLYAYYAGRHISWEDYKIYKKYSIKELTTGNNAK